MTTHRNVQTTEQRLANLAEANRIRFARAELKRDVVAGRIRWTDVLDNPDASRMKVAELLLCVPKVGRHKAARALNSAHVAPHRRLGDLTTRERSAIEAALRNSPVYRLIHQEKTA